MADVVVPMRPEDLPDFLALTGLFYAEENFPFSSDDSARMASHLLDHPDVGAVFLARRDGRAVGYMVLTRCYSLEFGGPFVLLDEIFVAPSLQGTGLGRRLMDAATDYCREMGAGYLRLEVQKKNIRSVEVYRRYGFRTEDRYLMSLPVRRPTE